MIELFINNIVVRVPMKSTVLEACETIGVNIPRYCFHHRLNIAGNCRMCLVEIEKSPKPQASCALPVIEGIRIFTDTPLVRKARETVVEYLLLNHPLDCPICDQGGECDLQEQSIVFGSNRNRFEFKKRGVQDKLFGPFIKTIITRCIHCTRCVRFAEEVANIPTLGTTIRGRQTEIGTYVNKQFQSEVSANVVDLCPVGALTSKQYAFDARPWELKSVESIDTTDGIGSSIFVNQKGSEIVRVIPRKNDSINEEWITDKARFSFKGLFHQRLDSIFFKTIEINSWEKAFEIFSKLFFYEGKIVCSSRNDLETLSFIKNLARRFGWDLFEEESRGINSFTPLFYKSSISLNEIKKADECVLLGVNPQKEGWAINNKLHKNFKNKKLKIKRFGNSGNFHSDHLDTGLIPSKFQQLNEGQLFLNNSSRPLFVCGNSFFIREDAGSLHNMIRNFIFNNSQSNWTGFIYLGNHENSTGLKGFGFSKITKDLKTDLSYFVGNEDISFSKFSKAKWSIYQGSHIDSNLANLDFLVPSSTSFEKEATYMNFQGDKQKTQAFNISNSKYRTDSAIIKWEESIFNLLEGLNHKILLPSTCKKSQCLDLGWQRPSKISKTILQSSLKDFYRTDRISKASAVLAKASIFARKEHWNFKRV